MSKTQKKTAAKKTSSKKTVKKTTSKAGKKKAAKKQAGKKKTSKAASKTKANILAMDDKDWYMLAASLPTEKAEAFQTSAVDVTGYIYGAIAYAYNSMELLSDEATAQAIIANVAQRVSSVEFREWLKKKDS